MRLKGRGESVTRCLRRPSSTSSPWGSARFGPGLIFVLVLVLAGAPAAAQGGSTRLEESGDLSLPSRAGSRSSASAADPGLDALLHLPSGYLQEDDRAVGGAGESEWRRRFDRASKQLQKAREGLASTKRELDAIAGSGGSSQWSVAPPGGSNSGGPSSSPLSFKLRQELERHREDLDEAERGLRELRIEADLAGVPVAWRGDGNVPIPPRIQISPDFD